MALSIAKVANWLQQVDKARAVVGWWPAGTHHRHM